MANGQKIQETQIAPEAVQTKTADAIQSLFTATTVNLSKTGSKHWTGDKNDQLARAMIQNTNPDENAKFSDELSDIISLVFNPVREVKMRVLKRYAAVEGFTIDATTEGLLDLQMDQGQFTTVLAKTKDPETEQALITKQKKKNRGQQLKSLFKTE